MSAIKVSIVNSISDEVFSLTIEEDLKGQELLNYLDKAIPALFSNENDKKECALLYHDANILLSEKTIKAIGIQEDELLLLKKVTEEDKKNKQSKDKKEKKTKEGTSKNKIFSIFGIVSGVLSLIMSMVVYNMPIGIFAETHTYGGDAYTGIQNAAAQTANNVKTLTSLVRFGFMSVLLILGLAMICYFGIKLFEEVKKEKTLVETETESKEKASFNK